MDIIGIPKSNWGSSGNCVVFAFVIFHLKTTLEPLGSNGSNPSDSNGTFPTPFVDSLRGSVALRGGVWSGRVKSNQNPDLDLELWHLNISKHTCFISWIFMNQIATFQKNILYYMTGDLFTETCGFVPCYCSRSFVLFGWTPELIHVSLVEFGGSEVL